MEIITKKTVLLIINNFSQGGAETMLVDLLPPLNAEFKIILVTLNSISEFPKEKIVCASRFTLNFHSYKDAPRTILQLRNIIKQTKPDLIHAQLYWSTIICRLATPKSIPFIFSVHSQLSKDAFEGSKLSLFLERLTYSKSQILISVSENTFIDYAGCINVTGKHIILNNFVGEQFFNKYYDFKNHSLSTIKFIAVGNLKEVKNFEFLLYVIKEIKERISVSLDIVGDGHLKNNLQDFIDTHKLPVRLLGSRSDVASLMPDYDGFIMCSLHEGFGNAPVEAMAVGLPLILNDLEVMKEMSKGNALFYESDNQLALGELLLNFTNNKKALVRLSEKGKNIAKENYSSEMYFTRLKEIYQGAMNEGQS